MDVNVPKRRSVELLKRGYSEDEISLIYELARLFLENGEIRKAEVIFGGVVKVAPEFTPALLGLAFVYLQNQQFEAALEVVERALKGDPESPEPLLYLLPCLLALGDYNRAGTFLGEVADRIENGVIGNPNHIRFFKSQLARYQNRKN